MFEVRQVLVRMRLVDSDRALAKVGLIGRPKAKAFVHDWSSTPSHAAGSDCVAGLREAPQGSTDNPRWLEARFTIIAMLDDMLWQAGKMDSGFSWHHNALCMPSD